MGIITEYGDAAMREAEYEELEDDEGFTGTIPELDGVIGYAKSLESCRLDLREALEGWIMVSFQHRFPVPPKYGIDLRVIQPETL